MKFKVLLLTLLVIVILAILPTVSASTQTQAFSCSQPVVAGVSGAITCAGYVAANWDVCVDSGLTFVGTTVGGNPQDGTITFTKTCTRVLPDAPAGPPQYEVPGDVLQALHDGTFNNGMVSGDMTWLVSGGANGERFLNAIENSVKGKAWLIDEDGNVLCSPRYWDEQGLHEDPANCP